MLVLVGGLVGGLFGREGGGCRGVGGGGGLWGVLGASGGGRKGQGSDLVMEFVYSAPTASSTSAKPRKATESKAQADSCGFTSTSAASDSDSSHSLADTTGRKLGPKTTTQRNPRCQLLAPRNSTPPPFFARKDLI